MAVRMQSERISAQLPAGLIALGTFFLVLSPGATGILSAVAVSLFTWFAWELSVIDLHSHRLPNRLVLPLTLCLLVVLTAAQLAGADPGRLRGAVVGAAVLFGLYLLAAVSSGWSIGGGDVKLAAPVGLLLGWSGADSYLLGSVGAFLLGGVWVIVLLARGRGVRGVEIPFGPCMSLAAWGAIVCCSLFSRVGSGYAGAYG